MWRRVSVLLIQNNVPMIAVMMTGLQPHYSIRQVARLDCIEKIISCKPLDPTQKKIRYANPIRYHFVHRPLIRGTTRQDDAPFPLLCRENHATQKG